MDEPPGQTYEAFLNELLITGYTSYEGFIKDLFKNLYEIEKTKEKSKPIIVTSKLNTKKFSYWVPPTKLEDVKNHFELLNKWSQISKIKNLDTLINGRNSYAHSGSHTTTFEQILEAFLDVQLIVRFLYIYYIQSSEDNFSNNVDFLIKEKDLFDQATKLSATLSNLIRSNDTYLSEELSESFNSVHKSLLDLSGQDPFALRIICLAVKKTESPKSEVGTIQFAYSFISSFINNYEIYVSVNNEPINGTKSSSNYISLIKKSISIMEKEQFPN